MYTETKVRLGVLASGNGTNLQAIIEATQNKNYPANVQVVLSDHKDAFALERAKKHELPTVYIDPKQFSSKEEYDQMLVSILKEYKVELVILAGFMRILSPLFINAFPKRILNIHPSLLPKYPGLKAIERALEAKETVTGCTVHFIDEGVDTGPVILQEKVEILAKDSLERLREKIHEAEHRAYPKAIEQVIEKLYEHIL